MAGVTEICKHPENALIQISAALMAGATRCGAQKQDPALCSLLYETIFVMQAAEYGSLHHTVSDRQPVSVLGGRDLL
jgi:hypothetical protein